MLRESISLCLPVRQRFFQPSANVILSQRKTERRSFNGAWYDKLSLTPLRLWKLPAHSRSVCLSAFFSIFMHIGHMPYMHVQPHGFLSRSSKARIGGTDSSLLVTEYFISLCWTHSTCLYLDQADERWDAVWPRLSLFKGIQRARFHSPFGFSSFLEDESLSIAAYLTTFFPSLACSVFNCRLPLKA